MAALPPEHENRPSGYQIGIEGPKSECPCACCPASSISTASVRLVAEVRRILDCAPLYSPAMPRSGSPYSVRMSNCGPLGWLSDRSGYRYSPTHR
jgi:alkylated DNA repair protein (DNA oxidative demethylase)